MDNPAVVPIRGSEIVSPGVSAIASAQIGELWKVHSIIELVMRSIDDEMADDLPRKFPLIAASDLLVRTIEALEPISTAGELEVAHGSV